MIAEYKARLQDSIDERHKGLDEPQTILTLKRGTEQMNALRFMMANIEREEHALLKDRERQSSEAFGIAVTSGVLATVLALVLIAALLFLLQRSLLARQRAEETISQANAALEERVEIRTTELRKKTEELARSNLDLEQFAYVASHDLQEPLRAVAGCVQVLKKRYQGQLETRADELIAHTVDGVNRMQTLIEDLLSYSRVGTERKAFELSDCNEILDRALGNLKAAIAGAGATVTRDPLPVARADAAQLTYLFQNLVGNAIKFRSERPPQIHVSGPARTDSVGILCEGQRHRHAARILRAHLRYFPDGFTPEPSTRARASAWQSARKSSSVMEAASTSNPNPAKVQLSHLPCPTKK